MSLNKHGYEIANYHNWQGKKKCAILRHDIDNSIDRALQLARLEQCGGVSSTYFVIVTSDFYNVYSKECGSMLREICDLGHEVGVHFDETAYPDAVGKPDIMIKKIIHEGELLSDIIGHAVTTVSMHRPSKNILEGDMQISGFVNSYSNIFFHEFKYVSDSRRSWRESIEQYIENETYDKLHILTHAFWYRDFELDIHDTVEEYINSGNKDRYENLNRNFTNLEDVMKREEIR